MQSIGIAIGIVNNLSRMISSVIYRPAQSQRMQGTSTFFNPRTSPIFQILFAKVLLFVLIFLLGQLLPQNVTTVFISLGAGFEFWITKNLGRVYLQASWYIDCEGEEDVWVYEANFKCPQRFEEIFWYSQVVYGIGLFCAFVIITCYGLLSLSCAILIAFGANYVNFMAFSKIITLRNNGVLNNIAEQVGAVGEMKETIKLPMMHRSKMFPMVESNYYIRYSQSGVSHKSKISRA